MRTLLFLVTLLFVIGVRNALACECVEVGPKLTAKEQLEKLDGVAFAGRVTDVVVVEEDEGATLRREVTFEVEEVWKGDVRAVIKVRTGYGGGDCGITFVKGERYYVEATRWKGSLSTGICDKTAKYESAKKLLGELGRGQRPQKTQQKGAP